MLDTSNIPLDELPEAMYQESMKSFGEAVSRSYSYLDFYFSSLTRYKEALDDIITRKDYISAIQYCNNLLYCLNELNNSTIRLRDLCRIEPKKPGGYFDKTDVKPQVNEPF